MLFLFVLGAGIKPIVGSNAVGDVDFQQFIFPGVIAMSVMFSSLFSAISIVWDREFGFLREMLVAPVSRTGLVLGKALGARHGGGRARIDPADRRRRSSA